MKHLKLFETNALFEAAKAVLDLPNVSLIEENMSVYYNPYVPETRLVTKYNVTSTSEPTALRTSYESTVFKSMEIDGVMLDELVTEYTFDTTGVHTVKYELYDETKLGGNNAPVFYNSNLVECIIPNSVTSISNLAFYECTSLTRLNSDADGVFNLPSGITTIGEAAFFKCYNLTIIDIPNSVTSIGGGTFQNCSNLVSCIIGSGITSIGNAAFDSCSGLTSITVNATTPPALSNFAFDNTNNCPIYVPSASVEAYKSDDTWYNYRDRIQAIP